jgi:hypothetical protein
MDFIYTCPWGQFYKVIMDYKSYQLVSLYIVQLAPCQDLLRSLNAHYGRTLVWFSCCWLCIYAYWTWGQCSPGRIVCAHCMSGYSHWPRNRAESTHMHNLDQAKPGACSCSAWGMAGSHVPMHRRWQVSTTPHDHAWNSSNDCGILKLHIGRQIQNQDFNVFHTGHN